ncbi:MAG: ribonuclease H-like domain-containing protein [candidate division WOR-3 bacterium]|nr:ribonuclease H-like domain-containing protein [candidate division WOR-3 bacterium]
MSILFMDIETIPGGESAKEYLEKQMPPPTGALTFNDIKKWEEVEKPEKLQKAFEKTSLSGDFGQIICIACIKEKSDGLEKRIFKGDEKTLLKEFWEFCRNVTLFVGHNILDFDLKFIIKRCIIHGVKPCVQINFARYRRDMVFDTMWEWERWSGRISLDKLAYILSLPTSKTTMDGSQVYEYYKQGKIDEICEYCMRDTELVRKIYKKMNFLE